MSIVNVKDLGVRGDGATLETAAIQKVINEAKDGDVGYYRRNGVHYSPKRSLEEIIL